MPIAKLKKMSLYYEVHGTGYPLLLIAGLNSDNASWANVGHRLAKHYSVIVFDNRGSGRSGMPKRKYSIRDMADDAIGLLDHLHIKKCHVIGHSMGGYIAQEMAIHHPERIGKLVLEATATNTSTRNVMLFSDFLRRFEKDNDKAALMGLWAYWSFSRKTFNKENYIATFIRNASHYPYLQSAEGFRSQIDACASFNSKSRLNKIRNKTLVIIGTDDIIIPPPESMKLAEGIKGSVCVKIKDAGHCVHVESPGEFTGKVAQFLK